MTRCCLEARRASLPLSFQATAFRGIDRAVLLAGLVFVEYVFSWPAIGYATLRLALREAARRGKGMGAVLFASALGGLGDHAVDFLHLPGPTGTREVDTWCASLQPAIDAGKSFCMEEARWPL